MDCGCESRENMLQRIADSLKAPSGDMSWTQLAGATVFVIVVILAWRQITHFIMNEA